MKQTSFLDRDTIEQMGFAAVGEDVLISTYARFYGIWRIHIGNHVRIDDFCIISAGEGGIRIGDYVHLAPYSFLVGHAAIVLDDFSGLSWQAGILSSSDDFSGRWLTNPTVPAAYRKPEHAPVYLHRHALVGAGSLILPGVTVGEGAAIGAQSLVTKDCEPFKIYFGVPAKPIKERNRNLLELECQLRGGYGVGLDKGEDDVIR